MTRRDWVTGLTLMAVGVAMCALVGVPLALSDDARWQLVGTVVGALGGAMTGTGLCVLLWSERGARGERATPAAQRSLYEPQEAVDALWMPSCAVHGLGMCHPRSPKCPSCTRERIR